MEVLGAYWLRRILARIGAITVYEGQDTRTGMPVMVIQGAQGKPVEGEGFLPVLQVLPEAWVLEWPLGAVPLAQYLGVADPERAAHWLKEVAALLRTLKERGLALAPPPELFLVKGKRIWLAGAGMEALAGEPEGALVALARALLGERYPEFPLRETLERLERKEAGLEALWEEAGPTPPPAPPPEPDIPGRKRLPVEPQGEEGEGALGANGTEEGPQEPSPSRPKVIRIEEPDLPSFPVVEPKPASPSRRGILLLVLGALGLLGGVLLLRPRGSGEGVYVMEFRTDPPTEKAEVFLLEAPPGSRLPTGQLLLTAPGRVEFDQKGVYRLRIRVPGRDPVDYLLEVPGPPLTIKVR
ncbi:hypothetical protein [Thermus brockianus]|uniref:Uncharacterized protein n=1 Tax=Thermus brockianus TaxID=56956 RepID=A0ABN6NGS9_THEBO|nr:hypothetical protein [Thermus brockianus]BDG16095.1 hypothetical protein TbrSNM41_08290 [Thermus brockianus]